MSRRIEVELTSRREDGTWTWRAAGAREPKGLVDSALLPAESKVGDNLRVEIEQFIDGIGILAVLPPRTTRTEPQRLELLGSRGPEQLVTTTVTPRGRRDDRDRPRRPRDGDRDEPGGPRRGDRRDGPRRAEGDGRPRRPSGDGEEGGPRRGRPAFERRPPLEPRPRPKRIRPGRTHRRELIASLPEEQRPIAEELSKGGIPGVRAALEAQNAQVVSAGQPEINPEPLLAMAEELWPRMRTAEWRDRAEAAWKEVDELDLRDLRSVVVAADSGARDDETRALAAQLRDALTRRVDEEHLKWLTELAELVADSRIVAALRRSSRPPKAGAPLPSDLARLLIDRTSEALNADAGADRWSVLLDALSFSPVRSSVTPAAVPERPNPDLVAAVRRSAARLPHIAALFGIEAPPTPPPSRATGRRSGGRTGGRPDRGGARGSPPPAPAEGAPTAAVSSAPADTEPAPLDAEPTADPAAPPIDAEPAPNTAAPPTGDVRPTGDTEPAPDIQLTADAAPATEADVPPSSGSEPAAEAEAPAEAARAADVRRTDAAGPGAIADVPPSAGREPAAAMAAPPTEAEAPDVPPAAARSAAEPDVESDTTPAASDDTVDFEATPAAAGSGTDDEATTTAASQSDESDAADVAEAEGSTPSEAAASQV